VYGKGDRPLLSWRVLILPYLEKQELYKQFRLDEPWDSPHNLPLLEQMPVVYALPPRKARGMPPHHTICHVLVGPGTAFEDRRGQRLADFQNLGSYTLLIIEAGTPVPWTKPEELAYAPDQPLPSFGTPFRECIRTSFADGSSLHLRKDLDDQTWRVLIARKGGKNLPSRDDLSWR
jgi:hypothetical protein